MRAMMTFVRSRALIEISEWREDIYTHIYSRISHEKRAKYFIQHKKPISFKISVRSRARAQMRESIMV